MCAKRVTSFLPREIVITSFARTPIGSFLGSLHSLSAPRLGAIAISNALKRSNIEGKDVGEVSVGHVLSAGCGQSPGRQASLYANIPSSVDVYSINKVCASGMKAICLSAESLALKRGHNENDGLNIAVACGMESMSNSPYLISKIRASGLRYGDGVLTDSVIYDGLTDPYSQMHMGKCAEKTAKDYKISREDQDAYAIESYRRSTAAWQSGVMQKEVVPVHIQSEKKKSDPPIIVEKDEEYTKLKQEKVATLRPAFDKEGTVTAANASKLNDGAAALVLMTREKATQLNLQPIARIVSFADAAVEPVDFPIAPTLAIKKAFKYASIEKVDFYEINEAFSCMVLANMKILGLDPSRVNCHGGAVSLGHPLGMSGCRIVISLLNVLKEKNASLGCAAICNGGGGSSAIVVEML